MVSSGTSTVSILGTNNEFGFDYLRDNMALHRDDRVQRGHAFAVVDEVDIVPTNVGCPLR